MARPGPFRLFAALAAVLLSFSGAGLSAAHALVHAHVAVDHAGLQPFAQPTVEDGLHTHEHEHASVETGWATRELPRVDATPPSAIPIVEPVLQAASRAPRVAGSPTLLPRPGPERGPPSGPRAPPTV